MLRQSRRLGSTRPSYPTRALRPLALTAAPALAQPPTLTPTIARRAHLYKEHGRTLTTTTTELSRRIRANLFNLRPYQQACVDAVLSELNSGQSTRLGVSAPTGSGKTAIFTTLIGQIPPRRHPLQGHEARQVLVVVNSIQLATQTAEAIQRAYPDWVRFSTLSPPSRDCVASTA